MRLGQGTPRPISETLGVPAFISQQYSHSRGTKERAVIYIALGPFKGKAIITSSQLTTAVVAGLLDEQVMRGVNLPQDWRRAAILSSSVWSRGFRFLHGSRAIITEGKSPFDRTDTRCQFLRRQDIHSAMQTRS